MLVEPDVLIRDAIASSLAQEGLQTLLADDGQQALNWLCTLPHDESSPPIHLVILDRTLPDLSGLEICRQIRQQGNSVPMLLIGERTSEADVVEGLDAGADDYLKKPFGMRELIARCRVLLRRHKQFITSPPDILRFQNIEVDCEQHRVTVQGRELNLSPKEFSLLKLFMQHPHQVISREQLLEQGWGKTFTGDPKTIDVHIRWLREKLEVDPSNPHYLITVRGFGYRLG